MEPLYVDAPSNEKTISEHSIMFSEMKSQIHMGILSRREMNVRKQKVPQMLTGGGTKYTIFLRWGLGHKQLRFLEKSPSGLL